MVDKLTVLFLVLAVVILLVGVAVTVITSVPVFQPQQQQVTQPQGVPQYTQTGMVTVDVVPRGG